MEKEFIMQMKIDEKDFPVGLKKDQELIRCKDCRWSYVSYYCRDRYLTCENRYGLNRDVSDNNFCSEAEAIEE